jgi:hypothetical protein
VLQVHAALWHVPWAFAHAVPSAAGVFSHPPSTPHESTVQSLLSLQAPAGQPLLELVDELLEVDPVDDELVDPVDDELVDPVDDELVVLELLVIDVVVPAPPELMPPLSRKQPPGPAVRAVPPTARSPPAPHRHPPTRSRAMC